MLANLLPHHRDGNAGPRLNQSGVIGVLHKGNLGVRIGKRIALEMQQAVSMVLMACTSVFS